MAAKLAGRSCDFCRNPTGHTSQPRDTRKQALQIPLARSMLRMAACHASCRWSVSPFVCSSGSLTRNHAGARTAAREALRLALAEARRAGACRAQLLRVRALHRVPAGGRRAVPAPVAPAARVSRIVARIRVEVVRRCVRHGRRTIRVHLGRSTTRAITEAGLATYRVTRAIT